MRVGGWAIGLVSVLAFSARAQVVDEALYASLAQGDAEGIALYLNMGGDPNAQLQVPDTSAKMRLLELAMRSRNEGAALMLLQAGARTEDAGILIEWAAELGFADVMTFLLDQDPGRVLTMRRDSHPLIIAIGHGHWRIASLLLDRMAGVSGGAELQEILDQGLMTATATYDWNTGGRRLVDDLLKAGASASKTLVLAGAVLQCSPELISVFLAAGADPRRQYDAGRGNLTPVEYAVRCFERPEIAPEVSETVLNELTEAGADLCVLRSHPSLPPRLTEIVSKRCR